MQKYTFTTGRFNLQAVHPSWSLHSYISVFLHTSSSPTNLASRAAMPSFIHRAARTYVEKDTSSTTATAHAAVKGRRDLADMIRRALSFRVRERRRMLNKQGTRSNDDLRAMDRVLRQTQGAPSQLDRFNIRSGFAYGWPRLCM